VEKFNLILSGGAALGYAHIGVLEYLHEKDLKPYSLHGVSMGAIVAGVEALDITHESKMEMFEEIFTSLKWIKLSLNGNLISTIKIEKILREIFGKKRFSDIKRDLFIGATNYHTAKQIIFSKYNDIEVVDALLASMAVPALFPPRLIDEKYYVDGYLSANLPLSSVDNDYLNIIVNVTGKNSFKELNQKEIEELSLIGNLERSIRELIYNQTREHLENFSKEYMLIEPPLWEYKTSHFLKYHKIKKIGYETVRKFKLL
jgi:NTE family protein